MGLDHPLVQAEINHWRNLPPEEIGIAVCGNVVEPVLLSLWLVETFVGKREKRVMVQAIAIRQDGTRVPAIERFPEKYLLAPPATPFLQPEQRTALLPTVMEPALQRELRHKGMVDDDGSYSAEMIGYVEIVG